MKATLPLKNHWPFYSSAFSIDCFMRPASRHGTDWDVAALVIVSAALSSAVCLPST
jgi:hypothetical protein